MTKIGSGNSNHHLVTGFFLHRELSCLVKRAEFIRDILLNVPVAFAQLEAS